MSWPTASDVEARTGIALTDGATSYGLDVSELLDRAKAFAESYCHRSFDEAEVTEEHDGGVVIGISRPPIVSVSSLTYNGVALAENDDFYIYPFYIYIEGARLRDLESRAPFERDPKAISITYIGGYSDDSGDHIPIPSELKEIVLEIACRWLLRIDQRYREDKNAERITVGEMSAVFVSPEDDMADLLRRLDQFKLPVIE